MLPTNTDRSACRTLGATGGLSASAYAQIAALILSLIISAYVMALGLGAPRHAWLAWLALLPLFVSIRVLRPIGAMLCGALWGLCLYVFSAPAGDSGVSAGLLSLSLLSAIPAAYACVGSWLTRRIGFSPFVLGVSWMGVELAFEPLGLRSGLLAGTQGDTTLVHWVGGALGYVLVAFLVALVNASLVSVLSGLRLPVPRPRFVTASPALQRHFTPQVLGCISLYTIRLSRPRAPPV